MHCLTFVNSNYVVLQMKTYLGVFAILIALQKKGFFVLTARMECIPDQGLVGHNDIEYSGSEWTGDKCEIKCMDTPWCR